MTTRGDTALHHMSALEFASLPGAIPCARLHAIHILHEWGLRALADDAALIVSELMTNALDASAVLPERPPITLRLLATETSLVIEAWDRSPLDLEPREADADGECGRGLTVVAALSDRWGWERTGYRRKVVWAELCPVSGAERALSHGHPPGLPDDPIHSVDLRGQPVGVGERPRIEDSHGRRHFAHLSSALYQVSGPGGCGEHPFSRP